MSRMRSVPYGHFIQISNSAPRHKLFYIAAACYTHRHCPMMRGGHALTSAQTSSGHVLQHSRNMAAACGLFRRTKAVFSIIDKAYDFCSMRLQRYKVYQ